MESKQSYESLISLWIIPFDYQAWTFDYVTRTAIKSTKGKIVINIFNLCLNLITIMAWGDFEWYFIKNYMCTFYLYIIKVYIKHQYMFLISCFECYFIKNYMCTFYLYIIKVYIKLQYLFLISCQQLRLKN